MEVDNSASFQYIAQKWYSQIKNILEETGGKDMKLTDSFSVFKLVSCLLIISCAGFIFLISSSKSEKENDSRKTITEEQAGKKKSFNNRKVVAQKARERRKANKEKRLRHKSVKSVKASVKAVGDERKKVLGGESEHDPSIIDFVQKALDDPNPEVGREAMELLEDYETPDILPAIEKALNSRDNQTRINAVNAIDGVNDPTVADLLIQALNDPSEEVRAAALELGENNYDSGIWLSVMRAGISSQYDDVKYNIVSLLEDRDDKPAVDIIILGFKDHDSKFKAEVNDSLDYMIKKAFNTYGDYNKYKKKKKESYDDELWLK